MHMQPTIGEYNESMLLEIVPSVSVLLLGIYFLFVSEASSCAKWSVGVLIAGSIILQFSAPALWLARLLLQVLLCLGMIIYFRIK